MTPENVRFAVADLPAGPVQCRHSGRGIHFEHGVRHLGPDRCRDAKHHAGPTGRYVPSVVGDPTGKSVTSSVIGLSSPFCKNIRIFRTRKSPYIQRRPVPQRGGSRSSRTRDRMRWTQAAPKTRALFLRTAKSCGPDASTLASSSWEASFSGVTAARKPDRRGEYDISRKTTARGMPGDSGVT